MNAKTIRSPPFKQVAASRRKNFPPTLQPDGTLVAVISEWRMGLERLTERL
ncbi:MAG TPA: hypothetical protein VGV59_02350 [Pyrinomonadaceae bacterium]|nr:hypothetical protein [Pyrinomonadaceae bacterium]